ncbi:MAG TPA: S8 family serine peptidase [Actinomycetes bacterium]|nr:S8 family serine peptidase [Actinomycetes bacterium]
MRHASRSLAVLILILVVGSASLVAAHELGAFGGDDGDATASDAAAGNVRPGPPRRGGADAPDLTRSRSGDGNKAQFAPDRVLVKFRSGNAQSQSDTLEAAQASELERTDGVVVAKVDPGAEVEQVVDELADEPTVARVEPDFLRTVDACGATCWQLGPSPGVNAAPLHARGSTGTGNVVAVLDSGVDDSIADLQGKVLAKRVCDPDNQLCAPGGGAGGHATTVASLIAAKDDGTGITGVAPGARIKSWKVDTDSGSIPTSAVVAALEEVAADPDVDVVNMSFSGQRMSAFERDAVNDVLKAGKTMVASAGNDASYAPQYPAGYRGVVSVGSTDAQGNAAWFSSYGKVDVVAPGVCVAASGQPGATSAAGCPASGQAGVVLVSGTSFSAPLVAGVVALRHAASPLRDRLGVEGTASGIAGLSPDEAKRRGHGLVNAAAWDATFAADAEPYLVVEAASQLPHQDTTWEAFVLRSSGPLELGSALVTFGGAAGGTAGLSLLETGVFKASTASGTLPAGAQVATASTALDPGVLAGTDAARAADSGATPDAAPELATTTTEPAAGGEEPAAGEPAAEEPTTTTEPAAGGEEPAGDAPADDTAAADEPAATTTTEPAAGGEEPAAEEPAATTTTEPAGGTGTRGDEPERQPAALPAGPLQLTGSVPVRVLRADDQAPGVGFFAGGSTPWRRSDSLQGGGAGPIANEDVDDVWSLNLRKGDKLSAELRGGRSFGLALYSPETTDVLGQWDLILKEGDQTADGLKLAFTAEADGTYLLDAYALGLESGSPGSGSYTLTVSLAPGGGQAAPVQFNAPFCSPNGDGWGETCNWTIDAQTGGSASSSIRSGDDREIRSMAGSGQQSWDGTGAGGVAQPDGQYSLWVVLRDAQSVPGRTLVYTQELTLDRARPVASSAAASPNPFEPVPADGDRDTTTFSANSNEYSLLRVFVYKVVDDERILIKTVQAPAYQPAGRITAAWNGVDGRGVMTPPGYYEFLTHVIDPSGNRVGLARLPVRIT